MFKSSLQQIKLCEEAIRFLDTEPGKPSGTRFVTFRDVRENTGIVSKTRSDMRAELLAKISELSASRIDH